MAKKKAVSNKKVKVMSISVPVEFPTILKEGANKHRDYDGNVSRFAVEMLTDFMFLDDKVHHKLRLFAEKKDWKVSDVIDYLVNRFPLEDDGVKPIVLKVPTDVMEDKELLAAWLRVKSKALVNYFFSEPT